MNKRKVEVSADKLSPEIAQNPSIATKKDDIIDKDKRDIKTDPNVLPNTISITSSLKAEDPQIKSAPVEKRSTAADIKDYKIDEEKRSVTVKLDADPTDKVQVAEIVPKELSVQAAGIVPKELSVQVAPVSDSSILPASNKDDALSLEKRGVQTKIEDKHNLKDNSKIIPEVKVDVANSATISPAPSELNNLRPLTMNKIVVDELKVLKGEDDDDSGQKKRSIKDDNQSQKVNDLKTDQDKQNVQPVVDKEDKRSPKVDPSTNGDDKSEVLKLTPEQKTNGDDKRDTLAKVDADSSVLEKKDVQASPVIKIDKEKRYIKEGTDNAKLDEPKDLPLIKIGEDTAKLSPDTINAELNIIKKKDVLDANRAVQIESAKLVTSNIVGVPETLDKRDTSKVLSASSQKVVSADGNGEADTKDIGATKTDEKRDADTELQRSSKAIKKKGGAEESSNTKTDNDRVDTNKDAAVGKIIDAPQVTVEKRAVELSQPVSQTLVNVIKPETSNVKPEDPAKVDQGLDKRSIKEDVPVSKQDSSSIQEKVTDKKIDDFGVNKEGSAQIGPKSSALGQEDVKLVAQIQSIKDLALNSDKDKRSPKVGIQEVNPAQVQENLLVKPEISIKKRENQDQVADNLHVGQNQESVISIDTNSEKGTSGLQIAVNDNKVDPENKNVQLNIIDIQRTVDSLSAPKLTPETVVGIHEIKDQAPIAPDKEKRSAVNVGLENSLDAKIGVNKRSSQESPQIIKNVDANSDKSMVKGSAQIPDQQIDVEKRNSKVQDVPAKGTGEVADVAKRTAIPENIPIGVQKNINIASTNKEQNVVKVSPAQIGPETSKLLENKDTQNQNPEIYKPRQDDAALVKSINQNLDKEKRSIKQSPANVAPVTSPAKRDINDQNKEKDSQKKDGEEQKVNVNGDDTSKLVKVVEPNVNALNKDYVAKGAEKHGNGDDDNNQIEKKRSLDDKQKITVKADDKDSQSNIFDKEKRSAKLPEKMMVLDMNKLNNAKFGPDKPIIGPEEIKMSPDIQAKRLLGQNKSEKHKRSDAESDTDKITPTKIVSKNLAEDEKSTDVNVQEKQDSQPKLIPVPTKNLDVQTIIIEKRESAKVDSSITPAVDAKLSVEKRSPSILPETSVKVVEPGSSTTSQDLPLDVKKRSASKVGLTSEDQKDEVKSDNIKEPSKISQSEDKKVDDNSATKVDEKRSAAKLGTETNQDKANDKVNNIFQRHDSNLDDQIKRKTRDDDATNSSAAATVPKLKFVEVISDKDKDFDKLTKGEAIRKRDSSKVTDDSVYANIAKKSASRLVDLEIKDDVIEKREVVKTDDAAKSINISVDDLANAKGPLVEVNTRSIETKKDEDDQKEPSIDDSILYGKYNNWADFNVALFNYVSDAKRNKKREVLIDPNVPDANLILNHNIDTFDDVKVDRKRDSGKADAADASDVSETLNLKFTVDASKVGSKLEKRADKVSDYLLKRSATSIPDYDKNNDIPSRFDDKLIPGYLLKRSSEAKSKTDADKGASKRGFHQGEVNLPIAYSKLITENQRFTNITGSTIPKGLRTYDTKKHAKTSVNKLGEDYHKFLLTSGSEKNIKKDDVKRSPLLSDTKSTDAVYDNIINLLTKDVEKRSLKHKDLSAKRNADRKRKLKKAALGFRKHKRESPSIDDLNKSLLLKRRSAQGLKSTNIFNKREADQDQGLKDVRLTGEVNIDLANPLKPVTSKHDDLVKNKNSDTLSGEVKINLNDFIAKPKEEKLLKREIKNSTNPFNRINELSNNILSDIQKNSSSALDDYKRKYKPDYLKDIQLILNTSSNVDDDDADKIYKRNVKNKVNTYTATPIIVNTFSNRYSDPKAKIDKNTDEAKDPFTSTKIGKEAFEKLASDVQISGLKIPVVVKEPSKMGKRDINEYLQSLDDEEFRQIIEDSIQARFDEIREMHRRQGD